MKRTPAHVGHITCVSLAPHAADWIERAERLGLRVSRTGDGGWFGLKGTPPHDGRSRQVLLAGDPQPRRALDVLATSLLDFDAALLLGRNGVGVAVDSERRSIAAQSTPLSLRQIYYAAARGSFVLSTCLPDVLRITRLTELAADAWQWFVLCQGLPEGLSWFRSIQRLRSGSGLLWSPERGLQVQTLHPEFDPEQQSGRASTVLSRLRATVHQSMESAERPFVYLSGGGRDSAYLLHLAGRCTKAPVDSLTVALEHEIGVEERAAASRSAHGLPGRHHIVTVRAEELLEAVDAASLALGQPPVHWYPLMWSLARTAREAGYSVGLDGGGANALLGLRATPTLDLIEELHRRRVPWRSLALVDIHAASTAIEAVLTGPPDVHPALWVRWYGDRLRAVQQDRVWQNPLFSFGVEHADEALRYFGPHAVRRLLRRRSAVAQERFRGRTFAESVHVLYLSACGQFLSAQCHEIGAAHALHVAKPFLDVEVAAACFAIDPRTRLRQAQIYKPVIDRELHRHSIRAEVHRNVGNAWFAPGFDEVLGGWMQSGPLRDASGDVPRPPFVSLAEFRKMRERPDRMLWKFVVFDRFQRAVKQLSLG